MASRSTVSPWSRRDRVVGGEPSAGGRAGLKSVAFVPLESERRTIGVAVVGSTRVLRSFSAEQLLLIKMLAAEGTLALERMESLAALEQALDREHLVGEISRRVRSESHLDRVTEIALSEAAAVLSVARCFTLLATSENESPTWWEWQAEGCRR